MEDPDGFGIDIPFHENPVLDDVHPFNLEEVSIVDGHAIISPEIRDPEAAQEDEEQEADRCTQELLQENEEPPAAEVMSQEPGDHQDDDDYYGLAGLPGVLEEAEQELRENAMEPVPCSIASHTPSYLSIQRGQQHQESVINSRREFLAPGLIDESQTDLKTKISDEDLNRVSPAASLSGGFVHADNEVEDSFVVNSIGVEPLNQDLDHQADSHHHHVNDQVQSDTLFHSLGNPGDDEYLSLLFGHDNDD